MIITLACAAGSWHMTELSITWIVHTSCIEDTSTTPTQILPACTIACKDSPLDWNNITNSIILWSSSASGTWTPVIEYVQNWSSSLANSGCMLMSAYPCAYLLRADLSSACSPSSSTCGYLAASLQDSDDMNRSACRCQAAASKQRCQARPSAPFKLRQLSTARCSRIWQHLRYSYSLCRRLTALVLLWSLLLELVSALLPHCATYWKL